MTAGSETCKEKRQNMKTEVKKDNADLSGTIVTVHETGIKATIQQSSGCPDMCPQMYLTFDLLLFEPKL